MCSATWPSVCFQSCWNVAAQHTNYKSTSLSPFSKSGIVVVGIFKHIPPHSNACSHAGVCGGAMCTATWPSPCLLPSAGSAPVSEAHRHTKSSSSRRRTGRGEEGTCCRCVRIQLKSVLIGRGTGRGVEGAHCRYVDVGFECIGILKCSCMTGCSTINGRGLGSMHCRHIVIYLQKHLILRPAAAGTPELEQIQWLFSLPWWCTANKSHAYCLCFVMNTMRIKAKQAVLSIK